MSNGKTNIERLVSAGVLDTLYLNAEGQQRINAMKFTDDEIAILKEFRNKLGLPPLQLENPTLIGPFRGGGL